MTPKFSVIVPVYNVEPYLCQCVDSILAQTFSDLEVILVDDGSPDGCPAICDEYAAKDARVTAIHQLNAGLVRARKSGILRASADYICFVDSDDWVKENWLQTVYQCLMEGNWPDMLVFSYIQSNGMPSQPLLAEEGFYDKNHMESQIYPYMIWDRRKPFFAQLIPGYQWMYAIRRELLLAHYMRSDAITVYEDAAMLYECLYNAESLYICPEKLYIYRQHSGSALARFAPNTIDNIDLCRDYMLDHLVQQAPELQVQVDAFFAEKIIRILRFSRSYHFTVQQTARVLADGLDRTGLAGPLARAKLPIHIRLFMLLLRFRLYYIAAALYRAFLWLCIQAHGLRSRGG